MIVKSQVLLVVSIIIVATLVFIGYRARGAAPAVLPPATLPRTESLGFEIAGDFRISVFASGLGAPRDLELSPEGILLASVPNQGKVIALPDQNQDDMAEPVSVLSNLNRPHGLAFYQDKLFVAEETQVTRYHWDQADKKATLDKKLFDLPRGGSHFTRTLAFDNSGRIYVSLGSTCNVCRESHEFLAAVIVSSAEGATPRLFAKGLRNAVFITVGPNGLLWGTEMGRDLLGDDKPPDEINIIRQDKDYGWPYCWGSRIHDTDFDKNVYIKDPCEQTESPVFEIAAHSAPLGLAFINSNQFPRQWQGDLLVAYHGSWNRSTPIGYKVVRLDVEGEKILGEYDFITGFLPDEVSGSLGPTQARGRPVDLAFGPNGDLYISDDKAGVIYRLTAKVAP